MVQAASAYLSELTDAELLETSGSMLADETLCYLS
jgi:hypothetical protein